MQSFPSSEGKKIQHIPTTRGKKKKKTFGKIQHPFMEKIHSKQGKEETFLIKKSIYKNRI